MLNVFNEHIQFYNNNWLRLNPIMKQCFEEHDSKKQKYVIHNGNNTPNFIIVSNSLNV